MRKLLLTTAAFLAATLSLFSQESIKIQAPNLVSEGELFNVSFIFEGEGEVKEIEWEPCEGFSVKWGPQKGTSTSISIINGKRTKSSQTTFTYVLVPERSGKFQLPPASVRLKGKTLSSGTHQIEVVAAGSPSSSSSQPQGSSSSGQNRQQGSSGNGSISDRDLFLRMTLSKSRAVVGEPVTATIKLFAKSGKVSIAGFEDVRFPSFNGFWSQELQSPKNIEFQREKVGEEIYESALLRSYTLIPQKSGEIEIDPAELVCLVPVRVSRSTGSLFDSFFQDDYVTVRKRISTSPLTVRVSALPAGAPSSFGGGVGEFRISARVTRDSLTAHDAASLLVTVSGRGNVSMLDAPAVSFPPDFDVYETKVTESLDKGAGRLSGSKTFEFPFIPRSHGEFVIPPVEYSYYDSAAGKYVTLRTPGIPVSVSRGNEAPAQGGGTIAPGVIQKGVRDLGSDIRFIETKAPVLKPASRMLVCSPLYWGICGGLALLFIVLLVVFKRVAALKADVALTRGRAATKMARKRLSKASSFLGESLVSAFYEELHKALVGFASDKFGISFVDMSKDRIAERLSSGGVPESLAGEFVSLLESCEFARFSSSQGSGSMQEDYDKAVEVISGIDSVMRHKGKGNRSAASAVVVLLALFAGSALEAGAMNEGASDYPSVLWEEGVEAYTSGNWAKAVESWSSLAGLGISTPELFCNLGNAYFKSENYGRAVLYYERALKLDPTYDDARFNLEFAGGFVQDRIEVVPEFFLTSWLRSLRQALPSNVWAVISIVLFALCLAMALLFLLASGTGARKTGFYTALAALILSAAAFGCAEGLRRDSLAADRAVVVSAVAPVKSTPGADSSRDLFVLHEGTCVSILDEVGEWKSIEIADGRRGWILSSAIEII